MGKLYVVKVMGRYSYFKTEQEMNDFVSTLPTYEQKIVETWVSRFGRDVK